MANLWFATILQPAFSPKAKIPGPSPRHNCVNKTIKSLGDGPGYIRNQTVRSEQLACERYIRSAKNQESEQLAASVLIFRGPHFNHIATKNQHEGAKRPCWFFGALCTRATIKFAKQISPRPVAELNPALTKQSTAQRRGAHSSRNQWRSEQLACERYIRSRENQDEGAEGDRLDFRATAVLMTERQKINMRERSDRVDFLERYLITHPKIFAKQKFPRPVPG